MTTDYSKKDSWYQIPKIIKDVDTFLFTLPNTWALMIALLLMQLLTTPKCCRA